MKNNKPSGEEEASVKANNEPGISKSHWLFGAGGFLAGLVVAGLGGYALFGNRVDDVAHVEGGNQTSDTVERFEESDIKLQETQDEKSDITESNTGDIGDSLQIDGSSIVVTKVEQGVTLNEGTENESYSEDWIKVHFTLKNLENTNKNYGYDDFTLESNEGVVKNPLTDLLVGEFGFMTLSPGGSKEGFIVFESEAGTGTLIWVPAGTNEGVIRIRLNS